MLQSKTWWYIPYTWIGCFGFIVEKQSGRVNWLGSGLTQTLPVCFWAHEHRLYCDLTDFTFTEWKDMTTVRSIVSKFRFQDPKNEGGKEWVFCKDQELDDRIERQFSTFNNIYPWAAFKYIREAYERGDIRFATHYNKK